MINSVSDSDGDERFGFSSLSAMVVDDNIHMRKLMRDILQAFGIGTLHEAADGSDAYQLMKQHHIDIVLCDWVMQNLSGIELLREVRKPNTEVKNPSIGFIMMTAHSDEWRMNEARDAGATTFLVKPFSTAALYERFLSVMAPATADGKRKISDDDFGPAW